MPTQAFIELNDLAIKCDIGTYGPNDTIPDMHLLDLTLQISSKNVLIFEDTMAHVFDYDPLIKEIDRLSELEHYETQERLMTLIVKSCSAYEEIDALEIFLRKFPVRNGSGVLGVRLKVDANALVEIRKT